MPDAQQADDVELRKIPLKKILGLRVSFEQVDLALKTAIDFIHGQQLGDVSYGSKSGGCVIAHPGFRERWLKVKWVLAGERNPSLWDGELLSIALNGVSKPRIFGHFDWEAIGICYRAVIMSYARGIISRTPHLESMPPLEPRWWAHLANAVATIQAKQTDRVYTTDDHLMEWLSGSFGLKLRVPFPFWQTAHGDMHWANLTAPEFSILDWETWGRAPFGFDIARLYLFSLSQPEVSRKVNEVFSAVVARPEFDVTLLYAAAQLIGGFEKRGRFEKIQGELHREVERVLEARRYAAFCE